MSDFLQTSAAKCTARDAFSRESRNPYFTGFFASPADRRTKSRVAGFEALPLCPLRGSAVAAFEFFAAAAWA